MEEDEVFLRQPFARSHSRMSCSRSLAHQGMAEVPPLLRTGWTREIQAGLDLAPTICLGHGSLVSSPHSSPPSCGTKNGKRQAGYIRIPPQWHTIGWCTASFLASHFQTRTHLICHRAPHMPTNQPALGLAKPQPASAPQPRLGHTEEVLIIAHRTAAR